MPTSDWTAYHTTESVRQEFRPEGILERSRLLDKPSDPNPLLDALMDEALTRIMLVSDGAVMALKARITGSRAASTPTSDLSAILDDLYKRYDGCRTHRQRLELIKEAQDKADNLRYAPDRSKVRDTAEWREAIAQDPRSCRVLAVVWKTSHMTIARIKKAESRRGVTRLDKSDAVT